MLFRSTEISSLVIACCDNSGISGVVTLKSPGEVFCRVGFLYS